MKTAKSGDKVKIHYTGKYKDNKVFETTVTDGPVEFEIGDGQAIPGLEEALIGMKIDEAKSVVLPPEKAYGEISKNLIFRLNKEEIFKGVNLELGQIIEVPQDDEKSIVVKVIKLTDKTVTLDGNHPLAGKEVVFDIQLLDIVE
ncbi:MAG: peptidylprolyl isomerase [Saprospiraceae bacterium]|nr:peptidylprolyl isomerase [Saprospiraceae bacterium]